MKSQQWLDDMKQIWLEKRPDDMVALLADSLEYFENPFAPPLTSKEAVLSEWQVIKDQDIEFVEIEILHATDEVGVAVWRFKEKNQKEHMGSYFVRLNEQGKCIYFRQFWNAKE